MYDWQPSLRSHFWTTVALLCLLQHAQSQNIGCGQNGVTLLVSDQDSAIGLSNCAIVSGGITIGSTAFGNLTLDGIREIAGNLTVEDISGLTSLSSDTLVRIDGSIHIQNAKKFDTLSFNSLTDVEGIDLEDLPALKEIDLAGVTSVGDFTIFNTFLTTLSGLNLKDVETVNINNNRRLVNIDLPLRTASSLVSINSNGANLAVSLPNLTSVGSLLLSNIGSIGIPSLGQVSQDIHLFDSDVTSFNADNLSVITGSLLVQPNENLTSISLNGLLFAGSIEIGQNPILRSIDFNTLGRIGKDLTISGNISSVNMPKLTSVNGSFNLNSTDTSFDCSSFDQYKSKSVFAGSYSCQGKHEASNAPNSTNPDTEPTDKPKSGLSVGAKIGIAVTAITVVMLGIAGIFLFMKRKKTKKNQRKNENKNESTAETISSEGLELSHGEVGRFPAEIHGDGYGREMAAGNESHEMEEQRRMVEVGADGYAPIYELSSERWSRQGRRMGR